MKTLLRIIMKVIEITWFLSEGLQQDLVVSRLRAILHRRDAWRLFHLLKWCLGRLNLKKSLMSYAFLLRYFSLSGPMNTRER